MAGVTVQAPAKVNLFLRVLGRRPDGYHDLETLFQMVDLCDDVTVELRGSGIELLVDGPDLGSMADNLAYRAALAYRGATGLSAGVRIALRKRIPAGAGLGGGSSDAAAVLRCLAALTGDADTERLAELGAGLGSDVPFFLGDWALALGTGRGEVLESMPALPVADVVLVLPPVHVSTVEAYRALATEREGEGGARVARGGEVGGSGGVSVSSGAQPPASESRPEVPFRGWGDIAAASHNDFEDVVLPMHGEIERSLVALRAAGARFALMSGSGAATFGMFGDRAEATGVAARLTDELGWRCVAARTLQDPPSPAAI